MAISTQTWAEAASLMSSNLLVDRIRVYSVGNPVTVGVNVTRPLTAIAQNVPSLVQTITLENSFESLVQNIYSVKVAAGTDLDPGSVVEVVSCVREPSLVGKRLLLDKVSQGGGITMIRKAVASDFHIVNQEGKGGL